MHRLATMHNDTGRRTDGRTDRQTLSWQCSIIVAWRATVFEDTRIFTRAG